MKLPIYGFAKPKTTLSKTLHCILGAKSGSKGKGTSNSMRVFKVGSGPAILGSVWIFYMLLPFKGGTSDLRLNIIKALVTGIKPGD